MTYASSAIRSSRAEADARAPPGRPAVRRAEGGARPGARVEPYFGTSDAEANLQAFERIAAHRDESTWIPTRS